MIYKNRLVLPNVKPLSEFDPDTAKHREDLDKIESLLESLHQYPNGKTTA